MTLRPKYRLYRASGQAVVTLDGRDVYLGQHGSDASHEKYRELVEAKARRHEADERKRRSDQIAATLEKSIGRVDLTIGEMIRSYVPHVDTHYVKNGKPTSQAGLIKSALKVLLAKFSELDAREFGPRALRACRDEFLASGLCRREVNRRTALVVQMFKWATEQELVGENVWGLLRSVRGLQRGRTPAKDYAPVSPVPESDLEATVPHLGRTVAAMVRTQELTGMRPAEVCTMRVDEIDMSGQIWEYRPSGHKCEHHGSTRVVMVGPKAQAVIREFLRPGISVFDPDSKPASTSGYIFQPEADQPRTGRKGEPGAHYTSMTYRRAVTRACKRAGVPPWSPNQLRHLAATRLRRAMGLDVSRALLGHSNVETTQIYAERDAELAREAMQRFG